MVVRGVGKRRGCFGSGFWGSRRSRRLRQRGGALLRMLRECFRFIGGLDTRW